MDNNPTMTVPSKLLVKNAVKNAGIHANNSSLFSMSENSSFDMSNSCASRAAMTATGICFNQLIIHFGNSIRLKSMSGRTRGINVTIAQPMIMSKIYGFISIFRSPSRSLRLKSLRR